MFSKFICEYCKGFCFGFGISHLTLYYRHFLMLYIFIFFKCCLFKDTNNITLDGKHFLTTTPLLNISILDNFVECYRLFLTTKEDKHRIWYKGLNLLCIFRLKGRKYPKYILCSIEIQEKPKTSAHLLKFNYMPSLVLNAGGSEREELKKNTILLLLQ